MNETRHKFQISEKGEVRVDKFLSEQLPDISRSKIKTLIQAGNVSLNGVIVEKAGTKAKQGDSLEILVEVEEVDHLVPETIPLKILYEDENVIVINKAAGMVVHPGAGNHSGTVVNALLAYFPSIRGVGESERPGVVHRLDKDTSGVLIFAKTQKAYKWLVKQFKGRNVSKTYHALVDGHPPTPTGRIEAPIVRDSISRTRMKVGLQGQGKPATTEYFELERFSEHTYLEVHPITGRTHQIRIHLSYLEVPVVGDTVYGRRKPSIDLERLFLHAQRLQIRLPGERTPKSFIAPLPDELMGVLFTLRKIERILG